MTTIDLGALKRWPDVPACYGWLSLDRRGQWRLRGEPVSHAGLIAFLNRQYGCDGRGNYFVQNGPQQVFVELEYTPWILRLAEEGRLQTHTGESVAAILSATLDEEGNLLLEIEAGIALLCDRDLPTLLDFLRDAGDQPADDAALLELMASAGESPGRPGKLALAWQNRRIPLQSLRRAEVARRFGFVSSPVPANSTLTE